MGLGPENSGPEAVTPRIVSWVSPPWPVTLTATPGIRPRASETLWMLDLSRSAPVVTDIEMGTSCRRCSRFCAVTTISWRPAGSVVALSADTPAAAAGREARRKVVPGIRAAPRRSNAEFIFIPLVLQAYTGGISTRLKVHGRRARRQFGKMRLPGGCRAMAAPLRACCEKRESHRKSLYIKIFR